MPPSTAAAPPARTLRADPQSTVDAAALPRLGFIGAGRVARCLAPALARAGYPIAGIASRTPSTAQALAQMLGSHMPYGSAQQIADLSQIILLTVPDDALDAAAAHLRVNAGQAVLHTSGATTLEVLAPLATQGAATGGFHPLYLFAGLAADVERLAGCTITIEAAEPLNRQLRAMALALRCEVLEIPPAGRALYHAGANYAASFALCLLAEATALWRAAGIDTSGAANALWPMLEGTLRTAREAGLSGALAGPAARGDAGTVARHLAALDAVGSDHAQLYTLLMRRAIALAAERPTPPQGLHDILHMLKQHDDAA